MDNEITDTILEGRMSRRELMKKVSAAGVGIALTPMLPRIAMAQGEATYFTWGGYDIPEMFTPYLAKHGANPNFATFGDAEEGLTKMRAGYVVDIAHPCNSGMPRWVASGLFQPIDTARLSHWSSLVGSLTEVQGAKDERGQWFAPMEWGQTSITYRTDLVELPNGEESWSILWDEKNAGKIGVIAAAADTYWCASIYAGIDFVDITDAQYKQVMDLLRKQRPLVRMYSNDMTSLEQALAAGELVAAMTWNSSPVALKKQGVPVAWANPKEGALTWVCGTMIHKDAPNLAKAHDIIDSLISPEVGKYIIEEFGYGHANTRTYELVSNETLAEMGLSRDPNEMLSAGHFQVPQTQEFETQMNKEFEEVMAGF